MAILDRPVTAPQRIHCPSIARKRLLREVRLIASWATPVVLAVAALIIAASRIGITSVSMLIPLWLAVVVFVGSIATVAVYMTKNRVTVAVGAYWVLLLAVSVLSLVLSLVMQAPVTTEL